MGPSELCLSIDSSPFFGTLCYVMHNMFNPCTDLARFYKVDFILKQFLLYIARNYTDQYRHEEDIPTLQQELQNHILAVKIVFFIWHW